MTNNKTNESYSRSADFEKIVGAKNPLVLAFIGDAYWTLIIREKLTRQSEQKVGTLHTMTSSLVSAAAQSGFFEKVEPILHEAEADIARRARNTHNNTVPKNASLADYKRATAFEAVIGYNYLLGNKQRIEEFIRICL